MQADIRSGIVVRALRCTGTAEEMLAGLCGERYRFLPAPTPAVCAEGDLLLETRMPIQAPLLGPLRGARGGLKERGDLADVLKDEIGRVGVVDVLAFGLAGEDEDARQPLLRPSAMSV